MLMSEQGVLSNIINQTYKYQASYKYCKSLFRDIDATDIKPYAVLLLR